MSWVKEEPRHPVVRYAEHCLNEDGYAVTIQRALTVLGMLKLGIACLTKRQSKALIYLGEPYEHMQRSNRFLLFRCSSIEVGL